MGSEWMKCEQKDFPGRVCEVVGISILPEPHELYMAHVEVLGRRWLRHFTYAVTLYRRSNQRSWRYWGSGREFPLSSRVEEMYDACQIRESLKNVNNGSQK